MGRSGQRSLFFDKFIRNQPTADKYIYALTQSPYKTHNRMAKLLAPMFDNMIDQHEKKIESEEFAKKLGVTI
jgi:hypothetical protein